MDRSSFCMQQCLQNKPLYDLYAHELYLTCMEAAINAAYARPCANPIAVEDDASTLERGSALTLLKDDTATNTNRPVDRNSAMLRRIRFK